MDDAVMVGRDRLERLIALAHASFSIVTYQTGTGAPKETDTRWVGIPQSWLDCRAAIRSGDLEPLSDDPTADLDRANRVVEAVDRWYTLKTDDGATFAEMQLAALAIRSAWEAWKADAPGAGGGER
jgi:hypothetical protein